METFAFELVDDLHNSICELHPLLGAEIHCSTGAPIGRTIPALMIHPDEVDLIDVWTHRIRVWMNVDGVDYSLGIFIPTADTPHESDAGTWLELQLHDQGFLLTENLTTAYGVTSGTLITDALEDLLEMAGVADADLTASSTTAGAHLAWQAGLQIADPAASLAKRCGYTRPWFDRHGNPKVTPLPYVGIDAPVASFQPGTESTVSSEGVQETRDRWSIPTEWRVQSSGQVVDYAGVYELPASHPLSQAVTNRRTRQKIVEIPGLTSDADAQARAKDEAQRESRVHRTRTFVADKNPELDQYDVVTVEELDMLLAEWVLPLTAGAKMSVIARESLTEDS
jgi:hypothetical protein